MLISHIDNRFKKLLSNFIEFDNLKFLQNC